MTRDPESPIPVPTTSSAHWQPISTEIVNSTNVQLEERTCDFLIVKKHP